MRLFTIIFSLIIIFPISINTQNCEMDFHNFFLIARNKNDNTLTGLRKYDYLLILKTEPRGKDKYHLVLNATFPINVNIELSDEILYSFVSLEKFCLLDLTREKGKYVNIFGTISEQMTKNKLLENIWIKVENVLLFRNIENDRNLNFYLLTNFDESNNSYKRYFLMNKMYNDYNQNFQIVSTLIKKDKNQESEKNFVCKSDLGEEYDLSIGDEISIINLNDKLRDNFKYNAFSKNRRYILSEIQNFICIRYSYNNYDELC